MSSMQTTTSRDNFRGKLHFQNVLNFGNIACLILGDIENIFICFLFRKKETVKGNRCAVPRYVRNWLQLFDIKSQEDKL